MKKKRKRNSNFDTDWAGEYFSPGWNLAWFADRGGPRPRRRARVAIAKRLAKTSPAGFDPWAARGETEGLTSWATAWICRQTTPSQGKVKPRWISEKTTLRTEN